MVTTKHICFNIVAMGQNVDDGIPMCEIMQSRMEDNGAYFPAQSIEILGKDGLKNLRDYINALLNEK